MCEFCEGKKVIHAEADMTNGDNCTLPYLTRMMFGKDAPEDSKEDGIWMDAKNGFLMFDSSSKEYSPMYLEIKYCPVCGDRIRRKTL